MGHRHSSRSSQSSTGKRGIAPSTHLHQVDHPETSLVVDPGRFASSTRREMVPFGPVPRLSEPKARISSTSKRPPWQSCSRWHANDRPLRCSSSAAAVVLLLIIVIETELVTFKLGVVELPLRSPLALWDPHPGLYRTEAVFLYEFSSVGSCRESKWETSHSRFSAGQRLLSRADGRRWRQVPVPTLCKREHREQIHFALSIDQATSSRTILRRHAYNNTA